MTDSQGGTPAGAPRRNRRWWWSGLLLLPAVMLLALPTICSLEPIANGLLDGAFRSSPFSADVGRAEFGWFSATRLDSLHLQRRGGGTQIEIGQFRAHRSLWGLAFHYPDLGQMTIDGPHIEWVLSDSPLGPSPAATVEGTPGVKAGGESGAGESGAGEPGAGESGAAVPPGSSDGLTSPQRSSPQPSSPQPASPLPALDVTAKGLRFTLRATPAEDPVVQLADIDLRLRVRRQQDGSRLTVAPATVLDRQQLTPEMCNRGLQLIAPVLADSVEVQGEVSLAFSRFEIPLTPDATTKADIQGELRLHSVQTAGKSLLAQRILRIVSRTLGTAAPERIRIADDCRVQFHVRDGRVVHEGLAFGLPEFSDSLQVRTRGSVGFDESLDLEVEVPLPADLLADGPLARRIAERPLVLRVTGTLQEPVVGLPQERNWVEEIAGRVLDEDAELVGPDGQLSPETMDSIVGMAGELLEQRLAQRRMGESGESLPLLERIRERRAERRDEAENPGGSAAEPARRRLFRFPRRRGEVPSPTEPPGGGGVEF